MKLLRQVRGVCDLNYKSGQELILFLFIGSMGILTDLGIVWICSVIIGIPIQITAILGFLGGSTQSFYLNKRWNFKSQTKKCLKKTYGKFLIVSLSGLTIRLITIQVILMNHWLIPEKHVLFINFLGIMAGTGIKFLGSKKWVFT